MALCGVWYSISGCDNCENSNYYSFVLVKLMVIVVMMSLTIFMILNSDALSNAVSTENTYVVAAHEIKFKF